VEELEFVPYLVDPGDEDLAMAAGGPRDLRHVGVSNRQRADGTVEWGVWVAAGEFVREEPYETQLVVGLDKAWRAGNGVLDVCREDREVWIVRGDADGRELTRVAGVVVDAVVESRQMDHPEWSA